MNADISVASHGSVFLLVCLTDTALDWIKENVSEDRMMIANALVVEPRYVDDLLDGMERAGLIIQPSG